ncbi:MAG: LapA family protein [Legionellaceae bacterium]|nr:LapA family protein [Legionellaceae bacterium]
MRLIMMIFYLCLILLGVIFAALNATSATLNLYFKTLSMPISVLMLVSFSLGILMGGLIFLGRYWYRRGKYRQLNTQLKMMEKEIKNLREIPLKD